MTDTTTEPRTIKSDVSDLLANELDPQLGRLDAHYDHDAIADKLLAYFGLIEKRTVATFSIPLLAQGIKAALANDSGAGVSALDMATAAHHTLHSNGFSVIHSDRLNTDIMSAFLGALLAMDPASMTVRVLAEGVLSFLTQEVEK